MASARHNFQLVKTILLNNFSVYYIVPGAEGFMYLSNITIRAGYTTYFVSYQGKSDDIKLCCLVRLLFYLIISM